MTIFFILSVVEAKEVQNGVVNGSENTESSSKNAEASVASVKRPSDDCQTGMDSLSLG